MPLPRSSNGSLLVDAARDAAVRDDANHAHDERTRHGHPEITHLSLLISRQETVVASLQANIAAIMSELSSALSASAIEHLVAEQSNVAALLAQEGAVLASLPASAPPFLITNLRARRSDLAQAMVQLGQLRSQIAQAEARLAAAAGSGRTRIALG